MYHYGVYYLGHGVPQDFAEAMKWYRKAAIQGHAMAQNDLGFMYDNGRGVTQDYAEAVNWYRKAAEQGNAEAQYNLGFMYYEGQGVPQDYAEAVKWWSRAALRLGKTELRLGFLLGAVLGLALVGMVLMGWRRKRKASV
jgi:TPR repeat protein